MKPVLTIAIAGALALWASYAAADEALGVVKRAHGSVTIERSGASLPATAGAELYKGDRVRTDANADAEVQLRGNSPLRVGPGANIAVDRFAADDSQVTHRPMPGLLQGLASLLAGRYR